MKYPHRPHQKDLFYLNILMQIADWNSRKCGAERPRSGNNGRFSILSIYLIIRVSVLRKSNSSRCYRCYCCNQPKGQTDTFLIFSYKVKISLKHRCFRDISYVNINLHFLIRIHFRVDRVLCEVSHNLLFSAVKGSEVIVLRGLIYPNCW